MKNFQDKSRKKKAYKKMTINDKRKGNRLRNMMFESGMFEDKDVRNR